MSEGQITEVQQGTLIGQVVSGHEIVAALGAGGMGEVYLARHQALGVNRAIKVIHDNHRSDDKAAARFRREAIALSRLQHQNVVQIIDFGTLDNGWPFLCMEYIEGLDLDNRVQTEGPMNVCDTLHVLRQLADALRFAHARGIVHRDLKPANVLLRKGDPLQVKVIDFGLASMVSTEMMTKLTADQQMLGSPVYMAPEQADGSSEMSGGADVYALAGIAYKLLSGEAVFPSRPLLALIYAHTQETPERLSSRVKLPALLDELLFASLAKKAADRPSADELLAHFGNLLRASEDSASAVPAAAPDMQMMSTLAAGSLGAPILDAMAAADAAVAAAQLSGGSSPSPSPSPSPSSSPSSRLAHTAAGSVSVVAQVSAPVLDSGTVRFSESMADQVQEVSARAVADLLLGATGPDSSGIRDAIITQGLAVVGDIAALLAPRRDDVMQLQEDVTRIDSAITDVEMDLALVEAELLEATGVELSQHRASRAGTIAQAAELRSELALVRRRLVETVEGARNALDTHGGNDAQLSGLFGELDSLVQRLA